MTPSTLSVTTAQGGAAPKTTTKSSTLDYDAFLGLLIAQLKNQDPTKPMDSAEYLGQLASFSAVEQGVKTNTKLDQILSQLALTQATGLIGKTVSSADGSVAGVVAGTRIADAGAVAILADGRELAMGPGIVVTQP
jgi:flagellar basal-body rod modification protein FlgD